MSVQANIREFACTMHTLIRITAVLFILNLTICNAEFNFMLSGILVSVFTPMDEHGNLNLTNIPAYASYLKDSGADGVVLSDIVGEGPNLSVREKKRLYDAWTLFGSQLGLKIILQIGGGPMPDTLELAAYAKTLNVDAILVLPPPYYYQPTIEQITCMMEDVSKEAPTIPYLYYDYPEWSHVHIDMTVFFKSALDRIPMFRGMLTDFATTLRVLATNVVPNQRLFVYDDILTTGAVPNGYDSFIVYMYNIAPQLYRDIIRHAQAGQFAQARPLLLKYYKLERDLTARSYPISALKAATEMTTGIKLGNTRQPLPSVDEVGRQYIRSVLVQNNLRVV